MCDLEEIFKHDSFAATCLYRGSSSNRVVVKFNRTQPILLFPMRWLGRSLARREATACHTLAGLPGVPLDAGEVSTGGHILRNAFAHPFIEGHPLGIDEHPSEAFFAELKALVAAMHSHDMAYVDLNKRENIIVTENGRPLLVDYQIHFALRPWMRWFPPARWLLRQLQSGDRYHLHKHLLWHRPDLVPEAERDPNVYRPAGVRMWRLLYVTPMRRLRRRLLVLLRVRSGKGLAVSELAPEKAVRDLLAHKARNPEARLPGEEKTKSAAAAG